MNVYRDLYPMDGEHVPDYIAPNIRAFKKRKRKEFNKFLKAFKKLYRDEFQCGSAWIEPKAFAHLEIAQEQIDKATERLRRWWRKA